MSDEYQRSVTVDTHGGPMSTDPDGYYSLEDPKRIFICSTQGFPERGEIDHTLLCGHVVSVPMGSKEASYGHGTKPHHIACPTCIEEEKEMFRELGYDDSEDC